MAAFTTIHETNSLLLNPGNDTSNQNNHLTLNLTYPLSLRDNYCALANLFLYYSWANITAAYGNNEMQILWPSGVSGATTTYTVTFPDGNYSLSDLNSYLQFFMQNNNLYLIDGTGSTPVNVYYISLAVNQILYADTLTILALPVTMPAGFSYPAGATWTLGSGNTPQVIIPSNPSNNYTSMGIVLGFAAGTYPPTPITSEYQHNSTVAPQISPVTAINLCCNLTTASYFNTSPQVIYCFTPNVAYGALISITPPFLTYFKCSDSLFNQIDLFLTDQNNQPLAVLDPNFVCQLYLINGKPSTSK